MKKLLFLVSAAVVGLSASAAWTYDPTELTISDGVWTFGATVKNGTELTVNAVQVAPSEVSPLDFSQLVTDADGASYTIVVLNPQFGSYASVWSYSANPEGGFVGELTLPGEGLVEISNGAFHMCTNLTGSLVLPTTLTTIGENAFYSCSKITDVTPFLPDTLTSLGQRAFYMLKVKKDLRVLSAPKVHTQTFAESDVTSVYFGPALKTLSGDNWDRGAFRNCANLTNVTFDAAITNATFSQDVFAGCPNITGTVDFSGFKTLTGGFGAFGPSKPVKVIFGGDVTKIGNSFFSTAPGLMSIEFKGKPPTTFETPIYKSIAANQTVYTYVPVAYSNEWSVYAQDGVINEDDSTFSSDCFSDSVRPFRPLVFPYSGGGGGELGDGVFANGVLTMPGGWKFAATLNGRRLTVNECTAAPEDVTPLDFSVRITDDAGIELVVVKLDPRLGNMTCGIGNNVPSISISSNLGGDKVGKLTLPVSGLTEIAASAFANCTALTGPVTFPDGLLIIGDGAFAGCTSLTQIENYVPDTVASIGKAAFYNVPAGGDLHLRGLVQTSDIFFWGAGIGSVEFGAPLTKIISSHWCMGPFKDCKNMTNIVFGAGISGASWSANSVFSGAKFTAIVGTLDLSGFTTLDGSWGLIDAPNVGEIVLAGGMSTLNAAGSFKSFSGLTNIVFKGVPPKAFSLPYLQDSSSKLRIATHVPRKQIAEKNASGKCWLDYAADGEIRHSGTTWAAANIVSGVDPANRPLLTIEADGLRMIIR